MKDAARKAGIATKLSVEGQSLAEKGFKGIVAKLEGKKSQGMQQKGGHLASNLVGEDRGVVHNDGSCISAMAHEGPELFGTGLQSCGSIIMELMEELNPLRTRAKMRYISFFLANLIGPLLIADRPSRSNRQRSLARGLRVT